MDMIDCDGPVFVQDGSFYFEGSLILELMVRKRSRGSMVKHVKITVVTITASPDVPCLES